MRQHSVSQHEDGLLFNYIYEETFRGALQLKIIKLRNISVGNMDFEVLKAAMLASKSTMLKGDDVTTEKKSGKMPGGILPEKLGGGVRPASQNPYPIYDQNLRNSLNYL